MSDSETQATQLEAAEAEVPAAPAPVPWTGERVLEWNRYYDWYVVAGVLLLVLVGAIHPITNPSLWTDLQSGNLIAARGPVTTDPFSYTMAGKRWVNVPWIFQVLHAKVWNLGMALRPDNGMPLAAMLLIVLAGLVRVLTAGVLLLIRRPGPGLWWVALCASLALGMIVRPLPGADPLVRPTLGGIAGWAEVESANWGLLLLAVELMLLHRAYARGCHRTMLVLVPLFLLWANLDESFLYGLVVLALAVVGHLIGGRRADRAPVKGETACGPVRPGWALGILAACAAISLVNPSLTGAFEVALRPVLGLLRGSNDVLTGNQISYFGSESQRYLDRLQGGPGSGAYRFYIAYYILMVGVGLASFALNRQRFSLGRFLVFAWAAASWGVLAVMAPEFAVILAAVMALNGQEWYQDRFGVEGRTALGWTFWSVGGRAVTLLAVFLMTVKGLTGYASAFPAEPNFGFGVNAHEFAFEAADYLADAPFQGNVVNLTLATGDAIIWKAWPKNPERKTYIDGRDRLFPVSLRRELEALKKALVEGKPDDWKPILDKYDAHVVMVPTAVDPLNQRLYKAMSASADWVPFYDDGSVVLFGRADAAKEDLAYFTANRLEPKRMAFEAEKPVPSGDEIPTPSVGWYDRVFQNRFSQTVQPHVWAAQRWLTGGITDETASTGPEVARCLMAIREARTALSMNPNDPAAWRVLAEAYRLLAVQEGLILQNGQGAATQDYAMYRARQRATVLNYAIESTPPPKDPDTRASLAALRMDLANLYSSLNYLDLMLEQIEQVRALTPPEDFPEELVTRQAQLEEQVQTVRDQVEQSAIDQQSNPLQRADFAMQQGLPALAIQQLEEAESYGMSQAAVKAQLLDLYCQTGRPDKAIELFSTGDVEDPALTTGPGTASYRQGLVYILIGSYDVGLSLWRERAIPQVQGRKTMQLMTAARELMAGQLTQTTADGQVVKDWRDQVIELPNLVTMQSNWEYQLGLAMLEAGLPKRASEHFTKSLELEPGTQLRPLLAYYLEQLGEPVPAAPTADVAATPAPVAPGSGDGGAGRASELPTDVFAPAGEVPR